ncbi:MAG TPA: hypothetical protein VHR45_19345 [Thermoanaerobaculia bacterium]|nr:hypothetical protein [Thermoanaerobaculia bacterium]
MEQTAGSEGQHGGSSALRGAQQGLQRWRERYGGRGVRIPERLWSLAVEAARAEGVAATAQLLRLDRQRLARLVAVEPETRRDEVATFVELRLGEREGGGEAVLELSGNDGELLRVVVKDARVLDVVGLARAFWSRRS